MSMKISLADDNVHMRNIIRQMIKNSLPVSTTLYEYGNGYDLINDLNLVHPDIIILDIRMKKMDGLTALREIKASSPSLPVILITQFDIDEYAGSASEAGAAAIINKSDLQMLITFLGNYLPNNIRV